MNTESLLKFLKKNPFLLAPMAGITDSPFRSFMKEMSCGLIATELVSAKSLELGNKKSFTLMSFTPEQRPVGVQIFGEELESLRTASKIVEQKGADFVDLNFGCPVPKIVKKGAGSAILKDLKMLRKVLNTVKSSVSIPVSIKVRTGWDMQNRNTEEVSKIAYDEGIIWLTVHGRTRSQAFSGKADWDYISQVKKISPIPIIGNGDLIMAKQIFSLKEKSRCDGMMIGRGCLKNPWIFKELRRENTVKKNYTSILQRLKFYLENFYEEKMWLMQYKKFACWYSAGLRDSAFFRQQIFQSQDSNQVLDLVEDYFQKVDIPIQQNSTYEASLMQGHG